MSDKPTALIKCPTCDGDGLIGVGCESQKNTKPLDCPVCGGNSIAIRQVLDGVHKHLKIETYIDTLEKRVAELEADNRIYKSHQQSFDRAYSRQKAKLNALRAAVKSRCEVIITDCRKCGSKQAHALAEQLHKLADTETCSCGTRSGGKDWSGDECTYSVPDPKCPLHGTESGGESRDGGRNSGEYCDKPGCGEPTPPAAPFGNYRLGHYIERCRICGTCVSQCRCMDKNKPVYEVMCDDCTESGGGTAVSFREQPRPSGDKRDENVPAAPDSTRILVRDGKPWRFVLDDDNIGVKVPLTQSHPLWKVWEAFRKSWPYSVYDTETAEVVLLDIDGLYTVTDCEACGDGTVRDTSKPMGEQWITCPHCHDGRTLKREEAPND